MFTGSDQKDPCRLWNSLQGILILSVSENDITEYYPKDCHYRSIVTDIPYASQFQALLTLCVLENFHFVFENTFP